MKFQGIIQIIVAVAVFSCLVVSVIFAKFVKDQARTLGQGGSVLYEELSNTNTGASLPGAQAMQRVREFLEEGDNTQAREKLLFITNFYSDASYATQARAILGEMNLDQLFSREILKNKQTYEIKSGDSLSRIANKFGCTPEYIMELNGITQPNRIHPGQEVMVAMMNLKGVINVKKKSLILLNEEQFLKEYLLREVIVQGKSGSLKREVKKAIGYSNSTTYPRSSQGYLKNKKMLILEPGNLVIREVKHPDEPDLGSGFFLSAEDMEELALFLKSGDTIEIQL